MRTFIITDRNGAKIQVGLRGRFQDTIRSEKKLKAVLDLSTSAEGLLRLHPTWLAGLHEKMAQAYKNKTYLQIMREFGMISWSKHI